MLRKIAVLAAVLSFSAAPAVFAGSSAAEPAAEKPVVSGLLAPLSKGETLDLPPLDERVPSPAAILGAPLGTRFNHWDRIVDYLEKVAAVSPRVKMWQYGSTYEGRPLELLAISSPENLERLDEIRRDHLRLSDPGSLPGGERERLTRTLPLLVWLAYGVHGNEASSSEAAMAAVYVLAAGRGDVEDLLRSTVVLVDPLANPDGRERYISGFGQRVGDAPNPHRSAAEHWEPWPGGRFNHYLIDLNRDWAWASQRESRARVTAYRQWEPQVYVDFHEMSSESSYFFPPSADPVHPQIDRRIVSWLDVFGRANAEAFDRHGWIYFKGESYDLFYPGYGDSYPSLRGAVGMTYEMAGGGRGGLALNLADGSVLTLADRVARHFTTSLATVRTAAKHARRLLEDFVAGRIKAASDPRTYLWSADQQEARALADLLAFHGIRVSQLSKETELPARKLSGGQEAPHRFAAGTYAVATTQPLGNLIEALLELDSPMSERFIQRQRQRLEQNLNPEFYDITAWSLPLAFNLETWVSGQEPGSVRSLPEASGGIRGDGTLGYLIRPQGLASYRLAAGLQERHVGFRIALAPFTSGEASYPSGTLFVPRLGNPDDLRPTLEGLLQADGVTALAIASSYDFKGLSLGSNAMPAVRPVRVGLLSGDGVDPTSCGYVWALLDQQIRLPHDRIDVADLRRIDLSDMDVLIFPSGDYDDRISDKTRAALDAWVKGGGVLVAIGDTVKWLQDHEMTSVKSWQAPEKAAPDKKNEDPEASESTVERELASRPIFTPGAALATRMRALHPLTLGLTSPPDVLFEGSTVLKPMDDPRKDVLLAAEESPVVAGFAWPEAEERLAGSLLVGMEQRGLGSVVLFAQDPDFRLFWRATAPLFLNAVLFGPSTGVGTPFLSRN
jgi:Zinc carboxypeptidase